MSEHVEPLNTSDLDTALEDFRTQLLTNVAEGQPVNALVLSAIHDEGTLLAVSANNDLGGVAGQMTLALALISTTFAYIREHQAEHADQLIAGLTEQVNKTLNQNLNQE